MSRGTHGALSEAPEETAWRVPGRVEVLGKHTDYAGGSVLVGAVDRAITARARRVAGPPGSLTATTDCGDPVTLRAGVDPGLEPGHWGRYLQTVLDRLTLNFGAGTAAHLSLSSDLPPASGMSSSSALVCATALALASLNGWDEDPRWVESMPDRLSLAGYLAPSRARTRAKAAIRSAGMLDSATRAARSKPARALPRWRARSRST